jgi:hypothetical protein
MLRIRIFNDEHDTFTLGMIDETGEYVEEDEWDTIEKAREALALLQSTEAVVADDETGTARNGLHLRVKVPEGWIPVPDQRCDACGALLDPAQAHN